MRLLSVSEPMLETLPLTPLTGLYGVSAGSSWGGPAATARPQPTTVTTASIGTHTFFINRSPLVFSRAMIARSCFAHIKGVLQMCYGLSRKRYPTPRTVSIPGSSSLAIVNFPRSRATWTSTVRGSTNPSRPDHGDRGQLGVLLDPPADLPAVELQDHDVEQQHVGAVLPGGPERLVSVPGQNDVVAFFREV